MAGGRPCFEYDPVLAQEICLALSTTSKSLAKLCRENSHWPKRTTIFEWRLKYPEFANLYTIARQSQVDAFIDDVTDIADDTSRDDIEDEKGNVKFNSEWAARSRIKIDTRKWIACKLAPKVYGERIHHTADIKMTHEEQLKELE